MADAIANGVEDKLIDGLSFKLPHGASYVTNRRSVSFHPQGSNIYKPGSGTRLVKFTLTGDDWLDPSTLRIGFDVVNEEASNIVAGQETGKALRPLGGPHAFFQRMRVLAGGQVLEDLDNYARTHEKFQCLKSKNSVENESSEAFGFIWNSHEYKMIETLQKTASLTTDSEVVTARKIRAHTFPGIQPNQKQRVFFKPLAGILNQSKFLPIRYMPLTFEFEIVSSATEPILGPVFGNLLDDMTDANTSQAWRIENVEIKCDLCTLDNALDNSYAEHLLSGKSLPINYTTLVSQMQNISGQEKPSVNVTRALTRLKSVFVSLERDLFNSSKQGSPGKKLWNNFWSPMSPDNDDGVYKHNQDGEFKFYIQVGSKLYPEYPIQSHSEAYTQLKKTLGIQASDVHSFNISSREYRDNKMILAIDTEKVLEAGFTGLNTRAGDLMRIVFEYANRGDLKTESGVSKYDRLADRMHVVLHSDQIVEIRDNGVTVFD